MKKVIFLVAALMAIFSGIAAVSAYEGHLVDVKAHVENALMVETDEVDFGIAFPQAQVQRYFELGLSQSFRDQLEYSTVEYKLYWERKLLTHGGPQLIPLFEDPDHPGYFIPIYPYIITKVDGVETDVIATTNADIVQVVRLVGTNPWDLSVGGDECDTIHFSFNPPVFDKWYNAATDALNGKTPSGILGPRFYYTTLETAECGFQALVPHTDLGSNFKIQVVDIYGEN